MLCASPLAKGLFHGTISRVADRRPYSRYHLSGENMKTLPQAEAAGLAYAQSANAASLAKLRELDAEKLPIGMNMGGAWPIIDGYVIPDDQYKLYKEGKYNSTPMLIGYNSDERLNFTRKKSPE